MHHIVKSVDPHFEAVRAGDKTFEIRLNDRNYCEGDTIEQQQYHAPTNSYSGDIVTHRIGYVTDYAQQTGYVVFSLLPL
jgi:ASC-1-like (ASCH) protein